MAVNIQKIFDITQQYLVEADSDTNTTDLGRLAILSKEFRRMDNAFAFTSEDEFPLSNQGTEGRIYFSEQDNSWYLSHKFQWKQILLDSDEAV